MKEKNKINQKSNDENKNSWQFDVNIFIYIYI